MHGAAGLGQAASRSATCHLRDLTQVASAQPWHTITVRRVLLKGRRHLQATTLTARQSSAVNYLADGGGTTGGDGTGGEAAAAVRQLLAQPGVGSVQLRSMTRDINVQASRRGLGPAGQGAAHRTHCINGLNAGTVRWTTACAACGSCNHRHMPASLHGWNTGLDAVALHVTCCISA